MSQLPAKTKAVKASMVAMVPTPLGRLRALGALAALRELGVFGPGALLGKDTETRRRMEAGDE